MKDMHVLKVAMAMAVFAALGSTASAQDKYLLKSPGGIAFYQVQWRLVV